MTNGETLSENINHLTEKGDSTINQRGLPTTPTARVISTESSFSNTATFYSHQTIFIISVSSTYLERLRSVLEKVLAFRSRT